MWKLASIIVVIILFAIFFIQNMVKVPVRLVVTEAVDVRLTYLLLTAFCIGYLTCILLAMARKVKKRELDRVHYDEESEDDLL